MRKRSAVESEYLASVLAELRRENVDLLRKKWKNLDKDRDDLVKRREHLNQCLVLLDETVGLESGIRGWVQRWDCVDTLLPELVSLAKIPSTEYRSFCLAVHERLLRFIELDWSADRDEKMLEAERRLRAAQDAINALSEDQRRSITIAMLGSIPFDGDDWTQQTLKILVGMAKITGSGPYRANEPSKRGPKRDRSHWIFRELVRDLWRIAQVHGGDFTLWADDRGDAKGTIIEVLHLLRPILPQGFVPHVIPRTTLNRLKPRPQFPKIKN
jgi:hypothetical protein